MRFKVFLRMNLLTLMSIAVRTLEIVRGERARSAWRSTITTTSAIVRLLRFLLAAAFLLFFDLRRESVITAR